MNLLTVEPEKKASHRSDPGPLTRFRDEVERVFDRMAKPWDMPWSRRSGADWVPALDISESEREMTIRAEVPGVSPKDIEVRVSGNMLTLSGTKEESSEEKGRGFYLCERQFGSFRRTVELPQGFDCDRVTARHENGVLTITIARSKDATPRHVAIKSGSAS